MALSQQAYNHVQLPALCATLSKLHFNRNISRAIVFGPGSLGGINILVIYDLQYLTTNRRGFKASPGPSLFLLYVIDWEGMLTSIWNEKKNLYIAWVLFHWSTWSAWPSCNGLFPYVKALTQRLTHPKPVKTFRTVNNDFQHYLSRWHRHFKLLKIWWMILFILAYPNGHFKPDPKICLSFMEKGI